MKIGLIGGTGKEGRGLALRWARAGHAVVIGSRDPSRARACADELGGRVGARIDSGTNQAAADCEVAVVCVPYSAHAETLTALAAALSGKIVVDLVVPLVPPQITQVHLPEDGAAALAARRILGDGARLVATLHHVSSVPLGELDRTLHGDVLVCSDDAAARDAVIALIADLGMRGVDAGPLANAVALEAMTPVLLYMNKKYKRPGLGLTIAGLEPWPSRK